MKNSIFTFFAVAMGIALAMGDFRPAYSQESASEEFTLEEITVTAQKREQQVQDVPIAMTITTSEQLERQMVYTLQDLSRTTPGLEFGDPGAGPGGAGSIRGIGTSAFDGAMEPSVGVVVDGVNQGTSDVGNIFDMERVEVLRGPQGTLFGNSSSAGVIQIITASPDPTGFYGKVSIDATQDGTLGSDFGRQQIQAMVNVPFSEKSAIRITANGNFVQKLIKGVLPEQEDSDRKNTDLRAKYLYRPSEDFSLNVIADYSERKSTGPNLFTPGEIIYDANGNPMNPTNTDWIIDNCGDIFAEDSQYNCTDVEQSMKSKSYGLSAEVDWVMANHNFVDIISYSEDKRYPEQGEMLGISSPYMFEIIRSGGSGSGNTFTNEFRVAAPAGSKLDYVGGLYYSKTQNNADEAGTMRLHIAPVPFMPDFFIWISPPMESLTDTSNTNQAAFADANYPITEAFKILGGVRYSSYEITIDQRSLIGLPSVSTDYKKSFFSWRIGGQYSVNKDAMIYGTVSRGVKQPVLRPPDISTPDEPPTIIDAEVPTAYELGTKLASFNNKLAVDFNVYYTDVQDWQGQACYRDANNALNCALQNIDGYKTQGFEIDIFGQPAQGLKINAGYALTIAEYPDGMTDVETGGDLAGEQVMYTPRDKITISGEYGKLVTGSLYGYFTMDAVYRSEVRQNTYLYPESLYPASWIFGSSIGVRDSNDKWSAAIFGRNLFDENLTVARYPDYVVGANMQIFNEQSFRQVGISVTYKF